VSGENWSETEIPEVEVISSVHEGTDFVVVTVPFPPVKVLDTQFGNGPQV